MRVINALLTVIFVLILVWFVYNLVIRFKKNIVVFKFRITSIRGFLIGMSINLFVIYCLIRIISFFAIRVQKRYNEYKNKIFKLSVQKSFSGDNGWDYKETDTNELIKKLEDEFEKFKEKVLKFDEINEMNFDELKEKYFEEMGLKKTGK